MKRSSNLKLILTMPTIMKWYIWLMCLFLSAKVSSVNRIFTPFDFIFLIQKLDWIKPCEHEHWPPRQLLSSLYN